MDAAAASVILALGDQLIAGSLVVSHDDNVVVWVPKVSKIGLPEMYTRVFFISIIFISIKPQNPEKLSIF